tara:strand:+ start:12729 stop:13973 length:1245 start_codon:yes stop_codon:yes gene_type:complete
MRSVMATQSQKVLIAVTGRMDSAVAAYLLKKQGMEVHAVAVLFHAQGEPASENDAFTLDPKVVQYGLSDLNLIKKVYDSMEIPFYAVNAQEQYYALVHDKVVAHRLMGRSYNSKVATTQLLFDVLVEKAKIIGAKSIATGHYAKLQMNQKSGENSLFSSPDLVSDQSFLLAGLTQEQLAMLQLPLSDMRKAETEKIAKIMGIKTEASKKHLNVFEKPTLGKEIEPFLPPDMITEGEVYQHQDDHMIAEHKGLHHFFLGQGVETGLDIKRTGMERDLVVVDLIAKSGKVVVEDPRKLFYTHVSLVGCRFGGGSNSIFPLDVYIQFKEHGERVSGKLYFKNNQSCVVEFSNKQSGMIGRGTVAVVYAKASGVARVLATGHTQNCFHMIKGHGRRFAPASPDDDNEIEQSLKNQMGF